MTIDIHLKPSYTSLEKKIQKRGVLSLAPRINCHGSVDHSSCSYGQSIHFQIIIK